MASCGRVCGIGLSRGISIEDHDICTDHHRVAVDDNKHYKVYNFPAFDTGCFICRKSTRQDQEISGSCTADIFPDRLSVHSDSV